ncbi:MAG: hypothetical protein A4S09_17230 [Proteobacteria bacterium SG_bin7]|nr:MAG: hypothetical protein A4S09_17230 [Proteobacteria bacterium SG_bin7]
MADALNNSEFINYLGQPVFKGWLEKIIIKSFRSYTNPTATHELFIRYGINHLVERYGLPPINQFLFAKGYDEDSVQRNLVEYDINSEMFFAKPTSIIPGLKIYHGTKTDEAFKSILLQGVYPSDQGTAGVGLYAGTTSSLQSVIKDFAANNPNNVVSFEISPTSRVVDMYSSYVKSAFSKFVEKNKSTLRPEEYLERFCDAFGIDILKYEYPFTAFVVKNSSVLSRPSGYSRNILTYGKLLTMAEEVSSPEELEKFILTINLNRFSLEEIRKAVARVRLGGFGRNVNAAYDEAYDLLQQEQWSKLLYPIILNFEYIRLVGNSLHERVKQTLANDALINMSQLLTYLVNDESKVPIVARIFGKYRDTSEYIVNSWLTLNSKTGINILEIGTNSIKFFWKKTEPVRGQLNAISFLLGFVTYHAFFGSLSLSDGSYVFRGLAVFLDIFWVGATTFAQIRDTINFYKIAKEDQIKRKSLLNSAKELLTNLMGTSIAPPHCGVLFHP